MKNFLHKKIGFFGGNNIKMWTGVRLPNRKTINNGIWMYLLQIFNTIVPLLTLPYITRVLGASKYGVFTIALNVIGYCQVIVEYGFGMSATRKVTLSDKIRKEINHTFTSILFSRCILFLGCVLLVMFYMFLEHDDLIQCICLIVLLVGLFGACIQQNWLFQGMQDMKYVSLINIISRIIFIVLIFIFIKSENDLVLYCILYTMSSFISGFLGLLFAWKKYHIWFVQIGINDIIQELKSGWCVFTTSLSSKVFGAVGITFMGFFTSSMEVGIYSAIQKIPNIIMYAWIPIGQVLYPISSKIMQQPFSVGRRSIYRVRNIILPVFIGGSIFVSVFSKTMVEIIFGKEYAKFYYWVIPLLAWLIVSIDNNFSGIQILLGSGHDRQYSKCFQIGVICTILLNLVLIYFWGGNGASVAPVLSEIVLGILLRIEIRKIAEM